MVVAHNIGIQMNHKELGIYEYVDFKLEKTFGLHGFLQNNLALCGFI